MKWSQGLPLGNKIRAGFLLVACIAGLSGILAARSIWDVGRRGELMFTGNLVPISDLIDVVKGYQVSLNLLRDIVIDKSPQEQSDHLQRLRRSEETVAKGLTSFFAGNRTPEIGELQKSIEDDLRLYRYFRGKIVLLAGTDRRDEAANIMRNQAADITDRIDASLARIISINKQQARKRHSDNSAAALYAFSVSTFCLSLGVAAALFFGYALSRDITLALATIARKVAAIAGGDLTARIASTAAEDSRNELDILSRNVDQMAETLHQRTKEVTHTIDSLQAEIAERIRLGRALKAESSRRVAAQQELSEKRLMLIHQNRMAAMGEMVNNIAHQWRQPLNVVGLIAQDLKISYQMGDLTGESLDAKINKMMETIQYMSQTIDDFRNFFRSDKEKGEFNVLEVIRKTLSLLEGRLTQQGIRVEVKQTCDPIIQGYPNEFAQVLLNIINNAIDVLATTARSAPGIMITLSREGAKTVLAIADNAGGIPEEILDKIFDPYFTTKAPDKGTGVGLYMSKAIIEKNMSGTLTARNIDGGAEFRIEI